MLQRKLKLFTVAIPLLFLTASGWAASNEVSPLLRNSRKPFSARNNYSIMGGVSDGSTSPFIFLTASNRMGIGTNAPSADLMVQGSDSAELFLADYGGGAGSSISFFSANGTYVAPAALVANQTVGGITAYGYNGYGFARAGRIGIYTSQTWTVSNSGSYIAFETSPIGLAAAPSVERMRIDDSGNVGIGSTAPAGILDVEGSSNILLNSGKVGIGTANPLGALSIWGLNQNSSVSPLFQLHDTGTNSVLSIDNGTAASGFRIITNSQFDFQVSGKAAQLHLDNGGNVGVGVESPQTALQVAGVISPSSDNTYSLGSSAYRFTTVYATNATVNTSDARLKTRIEKSDLGLDFIRSLKPVSYYWKQGDRFQHYGLLAQEVEEVLTKQASRALGDPQPTAIVDRDAETGLFGLRYTELIAPIIKSVQELDRKFVGDQEQLVKQIEGLKAANKELQIENSKLSQRLQNIEQILLHHP